MNLGWLTSTSPKGCKRCYENDDRRVEMNATQIWDPSQCAYADAWECPECGRTLYRDEGDGVGLTAPDGERL